MVEGDADSGGDGGDCLDGTFLGETAKSFLRRLRRCFAEETIHARRSFRRRRRRRLWVIFLSFFFGTGTNRGVRRGEGRAEWLMRNTLVERSTLRRKG